MPDDSHLTRMARKISGEKEYADLTPSEIVNTSKGSMDTVLHTVDVAREENRPLTRMEAAVITLYTQRLREVAHHEGTLEGVAYAMRRLEEEHPALGRVLNALDLGMTLEQWLDETRRELTGEGMNRYSLLVRWSEQDEAYVATSPELPGLSALGETAVVAATEMSIVVQAALELYTRDGETPPQPRFLESPDEQSSEAD